MVRRLSLRWRFLAAFWAISGISIVAAVNGLTSINSIGEVLEEITEERIPISVESLLLSRHVERVVTAAPFLLGAPDSEAFERIENEIGAELATARELLISLGALGLARDETVAIEALINELDENLTALGRALETRREATRTKSSRLQDLEATSVAISRLLSPGLAIIDARTTQWRSRSEDSRIAAEIADLAPVQEAEFARAAIKDSLVLSAGAEGTADLNLLGFPLARAHERLEAAVPQLAPDLRARLNREVARLAELAESSDGIPALRRQELALTAQAEAHLAENTRLSDEMRHVVDRLIETVDNDIDKARTEVREIQAGSEFQLIALVFVSLVASVLIVWLYVDRNLLGRLGSLSRSMRAVAEGNLRIELSPSGNDEITDMARDLTLFRDTAIEIEEKNLRRANEFLNVILPPTAAEELKNTGKVEPRAYHGVAIVFTDIVGFTRYCEHRDAQEIVSALDLFARRTEMIIEEEGLEKIKTLGDGLLMTCNLLRPNEDPVMAAVRCARRLAAAAAEAPLGWRLTSGVHFGSVVGGLIGQHKFTFDIWGAAVNLSSRLSDLAEVEICLSRAAWEELAGRCTARHQEAVEIKGVGKTDVYMLDRAVDFS